MGNPFRTYDIRGKWPDEINTDLSWAIGVAYTRRVIRENEVRRPRIVVGRDSRDCSRHAFTPLIIGIIHAGGEPIALDGAVTTPVLYFANEHLDADGGVMVTASHLGDTHTGMKFTTDMEYSMGAFEEVAKKILDHEISFRHASIDPLRARWWDAVPSYLARIEAEVDRAPTPFTSNWIRGHKTIAPIIEGFAMIDQYGNSRVVDENSPPADVAFTFDPDGDRLYVFDAEGREVSASCLTEIFIRDMINRDRSEPITVITDPAVSVTTIDLMGELGVTHEVSKPGHVRMKRRMRLSLGDFGAETSGHFYFGDRYRGWDDGLYAAVRLRNWVARHGPKALVDANTHHAFRMIRSPIIRVPYPRAEALAVELGLSSMVHLERHRHEYFKDGRIAGWWILRASDTEDRLVVQCEAQTPEYYDKVSGHLLDNVPDDVHDLIMEEIENV